MEGEAESTAAPSPDPVPVRPRRRLLKFGVLAAGLLTALYLSSKAPREQHLKVVLGPEAGRVTGLEIQYLAPDGEAARVMRMAFPEGAAPRIVSHEPELPDGDYRLRIDLDTREGRRSTERQVTLGGGSTQVDLSGVILAPRTEP